MGIPDHIENEIIERIEKIFLEYNLNGIDIAKILATMTSWNTSENTVAYLQTQIAKGELNLCPK